MITIGHPLGQFGPPPAPPPAVMFLHHLVDRYLGYAIGSAQARLYRDDALYAKEDRLRKASARQYRNYTNFKARWLALAGRGEVVRTWLAAQRAPTAPPTRPPTAIPRALPPYYHMPAPVPIVPPTGPPAMPPPHAPPPVTPVFIPPPYYHMPAPVPIVPPTGPPAMPPPYAPPPFTPVSPQAIEHVTMVTPAPPGAVPRMPPPPPAAELFLSQLADRYLRYALGSRQAATWRPAALFVKEQALQKASPRHYAAYSRMKARWLATARRAITPAPRRVVRPAPAPTVLPRSLMQMLDRYLRYALGRTRASQMRSASVPAKEAALRTASAWRYKRYMRSKDRWLARR